MNNFYKLIDSIKKNIRCTFHFLFDKVRNNYYFILYFPLVFFGFSDLINLIKHNSYLGKEISGILGMYVFIFFLIYIVDSIKNLYKYKTAEDLSKFMSSLIIRIVSLIFISLFLYESLENFHMDFKLVIVLYSYTCLFISWYISILIKKIKNMKTNELISFLAFVVGAFATIIAALLK
ncbi:hypothetical protein [Apilactobacillus micheneri]|uniref:hypothetical protein n=1 Tax=Apilactobacillus micheneri TaxID=1899430 RepID=UPI000D5205EA|nr:hypothetical protein [Apilactobacillus micheneri]GAY79479.1 hypothetical protein NBRC113063_00314 [Apilactobacillus micheneri]